MTSNCTGCSNEMEKKLQEIIAKYRDTRGALIQVLHEAQDVYGYLPLEVQLKISEGLNIPLAEIYGIVTFYAQFSLNPKGMYHSSQQTQKVNTESVSVWVPPATSRVPRRYSTNLRKNSASTSANVQKTVCFHLMPAAA